MVPLPSKRLKAPKKRQGFDVLASFTVLLRVNNGKYIEAFNK